MDIPIFPYLTLSRNGLIFTISINKPPYNELSTALCRDLIEAYTFIAQTLSNTTSGGAVILRGAGDKFLALGADFEDPNDNLFVHSEGFFKLLATVLSFPFPAVCLINGHAIGAVCQLALAHDYRVMTTARRYFQTPPMEEGIRLDGMGLLPSLKLAPQVARKVIMEGHRFTAEEALADGLVDMVAPPEEMYNIALQLARTWAPKAKMGVYDEIRAELHGGLAARIAKLGEAPGANRASLRVRMERLAKL